AARVGRGVLLCLPAFRDRAHAAALCRNDDRHTRLYRVVSWLRRPGLRSRAAGLGDAASTVGLGAICGASWMVLRSTITGLANVALVCTLIMSLVILAFTAAGAFYLALPCVFVAGAMMTITGTGAQTLIQSAVDARMSGRVMALYGM